MPVIVRDIVELTADLYNPDGIFLGTIKTQQSLDDVRVQIMEQRLEGYYLDYQGVRVEINSYGRVQDWPRTMFSKGDKLLVKLLTGAITRSKEAKDE